MPKIWDGLSQSRKNVPRIQGRLFPGGNFMSRIQGRLFPGGNFVPRIQGRLFPGGNFMPRIQGKVFPGGNFMPRIQGKVSPDGNFVPRIQGRLYPGGNFMPRIQGRLYPGGGWSALCSDGFVRGCVSKSKNNYEFIARRSKPRPAERGLLHLDDLHTVDLGVGGVSAIVGLASGRVKRTAVKRSNGRTCSVGIIPVVARPVTGC